MKSFMSVKLFTLFSLLLFVPVAVLADGTLPEPVLYIDFEQCDGGLYTGPEAYGGVACQPGKFGKAGDFDGIDDGVEIEDSPAYHFTDALTLAAWVRPDVISGSHTIVNKWYAMDSYSLSIANGKIFFSVAFPGGTWGTTVDAESPAVVGEWTHVAGVYDGSFIMLYLNGTMVASKKASGDIQPSARPISVGNHPSWNAYDGLIDEVRLYDTALTQLQVQELASTIQNPDFCVLFPKDRTLLYLDDNPSLVLMWHDSELGFTKGEIYQVLIWKDDCVDESEPICENWIFNRTTWVLTPCVANEIGIETGNTYYWKVEKFSQSEGRVISTDIGSFVCGGLIYPIHTSGIGWPGILTGNVYNNDVQFVRVRHHSGSVKDCRVTHGPCYGSYSGVFSQGGLYTAWALGDGSKFYTFKIDYSWEVEEFDFGTPCDPLCTSKQLILQPMEPSPNF